MGLVRKLTLGRRLHEERHRPTGFEFVLADRIAFLAPAQWERLTSHATFFLSRPYLEVLERSGPRNVTPRYALAFRDREPVAAVAVQLVSLSAGQLVRTNSALHRRALDKVQARLMVCGNLLSWGLHGVAFAPGLNSHALWPAIAEALYRIRRAERLSGQTDLVMVKDIEPEHHGAARMLARFSYRALETEPNMVLDLDPEWRDFDSYLNSMTTKYRRVAQKIARDVESAGCQIEGLNELGAHADRLHELYLQVHANAKLRLVTLPPEYLPHLATAAGELFRCTVIRRQGAIVGFITTLKDRDAAIGYYVGFDRALNAEVPIYLRLLQIVVKDAIELGCRRLSFGRTALEPKARLGARPPPFRVSLRHRVPLMNLIVRHGLKAVPHDEAPDRSPFK